MTEKENEETEDKKKAVRERRGQCERGQRVREGGKICIGGEIERQTDRARDEPVDLLDKWQ